MSPLRRHLSPSFAKPLRDARPIGQILIDLNCLSKRKLAKGLEIQRRSDARLGDILINEGFIERDELFDALAEQHGLTIANLEQIPPEPELAAIIDARTCLAHSLVPWRRFGDIILVATDRPDVFDDVRNLDLPQNTTALPVLGAPEAIRNAQISLYGEVLAKRAEQALPDNLSSRQFGRGLWARAWIAVSLVSALGLGFALAPALTWSIAAWIAVACMILSVCLKFAATCGQMLSERQQRRGASRADITPLRRPKVSMMVPLLHEREIAGALVKRLSKLSYPKALLDVVLVLEADDTITQRTLSRTRLPPWIRVIKVPEGSGLRTKPRALNYALGYCQGSIVGIWDAEDAPAPDQIEQVVNHFQTAAKDVVCLQGQLDYYNPRANWIARCFTIEYAAWWRLIMPGLAKLGFVIPLGGTTLFFKRQPLEDIGAWDAHNVTEDADLGLRLARAGFRTELIQTVTMEEANCRAWPWVRQRSRWLKGFAVTWAVHMRNPVQLWRDLGTYKFLGLQLFFVTSLSPFLLAPVFWSFWLIALGVPHPFGSPALAASVIGLFLLSELVTTIVHILAVRAKHHRHLMIWTPAMSLYFVMGCAAIYKALIELILSPHFWDKTEHGVSKDTERGGA